MRKAAPPKPCGTIAAYKRHHYNGEVPCEDCRKAANLEGRQRRDKRGPSPKWDGQVKSSRESHLWRKYGLTPEAVEHIFERQGSCCACCKSSTPSGTRGWCVDHDHDTGIIRGILCQNCNLGIGYFGDKLETAIQAVDYLKQYAEQGGYDPAVLCPQRSPPKRLKRSTRKQPRSTAKRFIKLEPHEPDQIKWLHSLGYKQTEIAAFYSVHPARVNQLVTGKVYRTYR